MDVSMRGVNLQRLQGVPGEMMQRARGVKDSFTEFYETAECMAQPYLQALEIDTGKGQSALISRSKSVVVGVVLGFVMLILIGKLAPEAHDAVNGTGENVNDTQLTDVPGGELFESTGFLIFMVAVLVVVLVFAFDLV